MDYNQFNCVYVVVEGARPKIGRNMRERGNYLFHLALLGSSLSFFFPSPCPTIAAILARKADLTAAYVQHTLNIYMNWLICMTLELSCVTVHGGVMKCHANHVQTKQWKSKGHCDSSWRLNQVPWILAQKVNFYYSETGSHYKVTLSCKTAFFF